MIIVIYIKQKGKPKCKITVIYSIKPTQIGYQNKVPKKKKITETNLTF